MFPTIRSRALPGPVARSALRRLDRLLAILAGWTPLLLVAGFLLAALLVPASHPMGQNSDGLIQTVFSLQKMTLFFWGQDRFANLLPALAMPIRDPQANAFFQLGLRVALGAVAPLFFCALAARNAGSAWRASLLATALLLAFAPQQIIFEAFIEASPYGTSLALAGLALLLFRHAARHPPRAGRHAWRVAGLVFCCAAYFVNVSLVLVAAPLLAVEAILFGSAAAIEFGLASLLAVTAAWAAMAIFGTGPPTATGFGETAIGLIYYGQQMLGKPGRFLLGMMALAAAVLLLLRLRGRRSRARILSGHAVALLSAFAVSLLAVALSSWVVLNSLHPRYLVPEYFLAAALGGLAVLQFLQGTVRGRVVRDALLLGLCAGLLVMAARRDRPPGTAPHEIVAPAFRPLADAVARATLAQGLDAIAGDYWQVWPAVFEAERLGHALGRAPGQVFGLTFRGEARRAEMVARLMDQGQLRIGCIGDAPEPCEAQAARILQLPHAVPEVTRPPVPLPDGREMRFVTLRAGAAAP